MALATSLPRGSFGRSDRIRASSPATRGALSSRRSASRSSTLRPLMPRSISNRASMRRTVANAKGEMTPSALPSALRRALASIPASAKNGRRACAQQPALRGWAPGCDRPRIADCSRHERRPEVSPAIARGAPRGAHRHDHASSRTWRPAGLVRRTAGHHAHGPSICRCGSCLLREPAPWCRRRAAVRRRQPPPQGDNR